MPDYLKHRVLRAKLGVSLAFLGLLAGLTAKTGLGQQEASNSASPAPVDVEPVNAYSSLYLADKGNPVYSRAEVDRLFLKKTRAARRYVAQEKFHVYQTKTERGLYDIKHAKGGLREINDKLGEILRGSQGGGRGDVLSSVKTIAAGQTQTLLTVPGFVRLDVQDRGGAGYVVRNLSDSSVRFVRAAAGAPVDSGTLEAGQSRLYSSDLRSGEVTIQLIPQSAAQVATFNVSWLPTGADGIQFIGQAITGTP